MSRIVLASASPQRKTLLEGLGVSFEVIPSDKPESDCKETDPVKRAVALAKMKAEDIASDNADAIVIGCDTLVVAQAPNPISAAEVHEPLLRKWGLGVLLEKPKDADDARRMLGLLSGKVCAVHSALCVIGPGKMEEGISSSKVQFRELHDADIEWWISTNQWKNRSGSFQIDGLGQLMIERIEGDWTGVVGLPVFLLGELMTKQGVDWLKVTG